jgi:glucose dehydrogenase
VHRYAALLLLSATVLAQTDWPSYGNDPGAMRYSTLRQINTSNIDHLKLGWTFRMGEPGSEAAPIVADGVMYVAGPDGVYALVRDRIVWRHHSSRNLPAQAGEVYSQSC